MVHSVNVALKGGKTACLPITTMQRLHVVRLVSQPVSSVELLLTLRVEDDLPRKIEK